MLDKQSFLLDKIISFSFYALFLLTPLIWTPLNFELFEYNKMMFVYLLTVFITTAWILKMLNMKKLAVQRTPLDIPLLLFLGSQILSTIFSIDPHTSIFGYYSRSNGGLLSIISYILLYYALVSNLNKEQVLQLLKVGLLGGLVVALWAIPEHFGVSPSCVILRGDLSADCWVQDVQARVFATLGQPNWLAAYLAMLIFPALYFFLTATSKASRTTYYLLLTTYYLAFTFTYSRAATLGLIGGLAVFLIFLFFERKREVTSKNIKVSKETSRHFAPRRILIIFSLFLVVNLLFGSAITRFQLSQLFPQPTTPTNQTQTTPSATTQLENGGTESGQIRLIVWQGAVDIWKAHPIFGSGVETFAYAYYQFRPVAHNLVSEWDFLYNKAHNEYLNYLATTGVVGLGAYSIIIITFTIFILKKHRSDNLLLYSLLASYISSLVSNFFGFSVVAVALLFYLFPAAAFIRTESLSPLVLPKKLRLPKALKIPLQLATALLATFLVVSLGLMWKADTLFAQGESNSSRGHPGLAYQDLSKAVKLNKLEPFYNSELGYAAAEAALALKEADATLSAMLKDQAFLETEQALRVSPKNVSFYRTAARTYYVLSSLDPNFIQKTIEIIDQTSALAPTDPKPYYNKGVILGTVDRNNEAITSLQKAVELKPNYRDAYYALSLFYFDKKQYHEAVDYMNKVLKLVPNDAEALSQLASWAKQGIATGPSEAR